jgi:hypothetical protein
MSMIADRKTANMKETKKMDEPMASLSSASLANAFYIPNHMKT